LAEEGAWFIASPIMARHCGWLLAVAIFQNVTHVINYDLPTKELMTMSTVLAVQVMGGYCLGSS
jgi:hypothetical protein